MVGPQVELSESANQVIGLTTDHKAILILCTYAGNIGRY